MRKIWLLTISLLLVAVTLLITIYYYLNAPSNKPMLTIEFNKPPPWIIRPGENLTLIITIKNQGKDSAKNIGVNLTISKGFKITQSGINQYNEKFQEIRAGEEKVLVLTIILTDAIPPGDYPLTLIVHAENTSPLTFNDKITVQLPT